MLGISGEQPAGEYSIELFTTHREQVQLGEQGTLYQDWLNDCLHAVVK